MVKLKNFITDIIDADLASGKIENIVTRFPPEPNGWLHIGHAKSITLNFTLAEQYGGKCHLRFDDTNPSAEELEFINGIQEDVRWLGFDWGNNLFYASDYFDTLYEYAIILIQKGLAYVDSQTPEEVRNHRGSVNVPGVNSPFRDRSIEDNLMLFADMRSGKLAPGEAILRAKIDMCHGNMNMRDPPLYRILHESHPRTHKKWCIYPIYDFAHGQSDSIERVTHSICTLEFVDHKPLYEWFQEHLGIHRSQQIENARLNITHTVMSKRKLLKLVTGKYVRGWDDPRLPTLAGCRRRGIPPSAIRQFAIEAGVARREHVIHVMKLENIIRDHLKDVPRKWAVLDPLELVITNFHEGVNAVKNPKGTVHQNALRSTVFIDASDFSCNPPEGWKRLSVGSSVRLKDSCIITAAAVDVDELGKAIRVHATAEFDDAIKPHKNLVSIQWLSKEESLMSELRLYDRLFTKENPEEGDWVENLNPNSMKVVSGMIEASIATASHYDRFQFERIGYFVVDQDSNGEKLVFNRIVQLSDDFAACTDVHGNAAAHKEASKAARLAAATRRAEIKAARERRKSPDG